MFNLFNKPKTLHNKPAAKTWILPHVDMLPTIQADDATANTLPVDKNLLLAYVGMITKTRIVDIDINNRSTLYHMDCINFLEYPKIKKNLVSLQAALHTKIKMIDSKKAQFAFEINNETATIVHFKSIVKTMEKAGLNCVIGRDTENNDITLNLEKAPHVLIAGQTGSGKSVLQNAMIASLLMNYTPNELQLVLVDPKRSELTQFAGIPHLLTDVVTTAEKAALTLSYIENVMEERYSTLSKMGKQNGKGIYSNIVIVIDELADLMLSSYKKSIETSLTRIAQLGRAANIHLILATQRPTVNVVTGLIKANVPTRIALNVASVRDSMTIIDHKGAETLQGNGDGLLRKSGSIIETHFQAAYIDSTTIKTIVTAWKNQK